MANNPPPRRVALIAVHGVADQQPGQTARAAVELLVASSPKDMTRRVSYSATHSDQVTLPVDPLKLKPDPANLCVGATPTGKTRSFRKALALSFKSDFHRRHWRAQPNPVSASRPQAQARTHPNADRGIAITDYLLAKHRRNGARRTVYETTCLGLERHENGIHTHDVDVYEMYWADLSRLSGSVPRILTELFTLVFHLSTLGRNTVEEAYNRFASLGNSRLGTWRIASLLHKTLDWIYINVLSLLVLQLLLLSIFLVGLRAASAVPLGKLHISVLIGLIIVISLLLLYAKKWALLVPAAIVILAWAPAPLLPFTSPALKLALTPLLLLALLTLANEGVLRVAEDRAPLVHRIGRWLWLCVVLFLLGGALPAIDIMAREMSSTVQTAVTVEAETTGVERVYTELRQAWVPTILLATEMLLWLFKWVSVLVVILFALSLMLGFRASLDSSFEASASIATGRLGLVLSLGLFLALCMAGWALLTTVLGTAVHNIDYEPLLFELPGAKYVCYLPGAAAAFLNHRYLQSTMAFSLVAILLAALMIYVALSVLPGVLVEFRFLAQRMRGRDNKDRRMFHTRSIGQWMTGGYRWLDKAALFTVVAGLLFMLALVYIPGGASYASEWSQALLKGLVLPAAGFAGLLVAFGGLLSRYVPMLRAPLDAALDVDNHLREFPRTDIPRARIFSRYAALLKHVGAQGYEHVVIVAHSQGTVISAELLRYLCSNGTRLGVNRPRIDKVRLPPLSFLTMGCPLRQLYAARFPTLYRWVIKHHRNGVCGPRASDIGVVRWINAFCSGDYVGRWLWSFDFPPAKGNKLVHPMAMSINQQEGLGRIDVYAPFVPTPPVPSSLKNFQELEVCLGLGAHTHYFDRDQELVAWLTDHLIIGK